MSVFGVSGAPVSVDVIENAETLSQNQEQTEVDKGQCASFSNELRSYIRFEMKINELSIRYACVNKHAAAV